MTTNIFLYKKMLLTVEILNCDLKKNVQCELTH